MDISPIARLYRWLEYAAFGRALERSRWALLPHLAGARRVLVLGEGDGRMLRRMLAAAPHAHFDVVEQSPRMIELAVARAGHAAARVRFLCADARTLTYEETYDAIVACYFLDCFDTPTARHIIERATHALTPQGQWLVADFTLPRSGWPHWHARLWLAAMYGFFRVSTGLRTTALPPYEALLAHCGFRAAVRLQARNQMIRACVWQRSEP